MDEWSLPGFTEIRALGEGGFGRVVLARHDGTGTLVAIKYLFSRYLSDPARLAAFRREAEILRRVPSAHITRLYEFAETPYGAAIVMEAVRGVPLRELLLVDGRLEPESALAVLKGSLLGLADAHRAGIVHRDYKPDNVLVGPDRESKLVDFGIATLAGETGLPIGTPAYMAPEQWHGLPASPATDVYAATCVFFQGVTGRKPFPAEDTETLREMHEHAPVPLEMAPEPVRALIAGGMAKDPGQRPVGAAEFVGELETAAVAGYGEDWEERGLSRLAQRTGVLLALSPLALLTVGTAAAPTIAAGTAAAGVGSGVATAAGFLTGGKIAAIVGAVVAAAVATVVVVTVNNDPAPPAAAPATTSVTPAALAVNLKTRTGTENNFDVSAQYAEVTGISDPAVQQRINKVLSAPVDEWISYVREGALEREPDGSRAHAHNKVTIDRQDDKVLSVHYELSVDSTQFGNHGGYDMKLINVDLRTGKQITAGDVFTGISTSQAAMSKLEQRILAHAPGGGYCETDTGSRGLQPVDLEPYTLGGDPVLQMAFTDQGVDFSVGAGALGYALACGFPEFVVPYQELSNLVTPAGRALLPGN
ncbi:serine/threonine-protein kinase [Amycolatopsis sp.]|uniref:serine/threonine-protein kinase n=1 Tax=Amycolatopsis sp. TaxID=37632 RepID=UPI002BA2041D|nr:serine/threonine-protein kinase [Amycolatopsis sp.]HVV09170.1 serine/threonine-protein kinase [Amycolatopsis sp.]